MSFVEQGGGSGVLSEEEDKQVHLWIEKSENYKVKKNMLYV